MSGPRDAREEAARARSILAWIIEDGAAFAPPRADGAHPLLTRDRPARTAMIVDGTFVDRMVAAGWLGRGAGGIHVTAAGKRWFARATPCGPGREVVLRPAPAEGADPGDTDRVAVNARESPLEWLRARKGRDGKPLLSAAQYEAGNRLRLDFTRAGMSPRMGVDWGGVRVDASGRGEGLDEARLDARQRLRDALDAAGDEFAGLLLDVCCFLKGLEEVERGRGWPRKSARIVLRMALDRLARHYGLGEAGGRARAPLRRWGGEGYRPSMDG
ncbi:MAG: DUF6456 domain-containing protein [Flavobacteriaceae bacterium]